MESGGINNEILITEVRKRRSLWDQKSYDYLNRSLKSKEWEGVAQKIKAPVEEVKNRWKLLKDSFNREVRNITRNNTPTKWAHFEQMSFLIKGSNNLLLPSAYLSQSLVEIDSQNTASSFDNELSENSTTAPEEKYSPFAKKRKLMTNRSQLNNTTENSSSVVYQSSPLVDWNESGAFLHERGNEDYLFLMSLLPTLEKMSARQKMLLKIKMMQEVYEATFNDSMNELSAIKNSSMDNNLNSVSSGS